VKTAKDAFGNGKSAVGGADFGTPTAKIAKNAVGGAISGTPTAVGGLQKEHAGHPGRKKASRRGLAWGNRTGRGEPVKAD